MEVTILKNEKLLQDVYKYYSTFTNHEIYNKKKELRQKKIDVKEDAKIGFYKDVSEIARGYAILDWTDYESCCYEFKILLHKAQNLLDDDIELINVLKGVRNDLRIFISILEPYYYMFIEETKYLEHDRLWLFNKIDIYDKEIEILKNKLDTYFTKKKYIKLLDSDVKILVPNIQTEYKDLGTVNVFDCLFTDLVTVVRENKQN